jgi:hypothetical protein
LEADLTSIQLPERYTTSKYYGESYLEDNDPDGAEEVNNMMELMKLKKMTSAPTSHWALDAHSHHTWRGPQKNQGRDFRKFATGAYYEQSFVEDYRQNLFDSSDVAKYLRTSLSACLSTFYKGRNTIYKGRITKHKDYPFPDPCKNTNCNERPEFDIDDVISDNDKFAYLAKAGKSIRALKKSLTNHYCARIAPGSKKLHPSVKTAVEKLISVRPSSPFSFLHLTLPRCTGT